VENEVVVSKDTISIGKDNIDCAFNELRKHLADNEDGRLSDLHQGASKKLGGSERYDEQYMVLHNNNTTDIDFITYSKNGEIFIEIAGLKEFGFPNYYSENLARNCNGNIINSTTYNIN
jgi:hypothetical protein